MIHDRPIIVCLCGSMRFGATFEKAMLEETLAGRIVLTVGTHKSHDKDLGIDDDSDVKVMLDNLHLRKIDMADEVLILNVKGYIGQSTKRELEYARFLHKQIRFLEPYADA